MTPRTNRRGSRRPPPPPPRPRFEGGASRRRPLLDGFHPSRYFPFPSDFGTVTTRVAVAAFPAASVAVQVRV